MSPPPPELIYAVGDVHGRFDLLTEAMGAIERHAADRRRRMVFLGDYVDRGPDSRRVIEALIDLQSRADVICLKGNHEDMLLRALTEGGRRNLAQWLMNGGEATLRSYGAADADEARRRVPPAHLAWMANLPLSATDGRRIYVHAGLEPGAPLADQTEEARLWIREAFLRAPASAFACHVVHGHTPFWHGKPDPDRPELLAHRTNLDTGAFATGVLSIGVFDPARGGGPLEVLSARGAKASRKAPPVNAP